ncbi:MAG: LPS assembly lipoprotein LptE [Gammaproteobacteria bacterium]|nr:LPS assembly lipoprotein LptE [Gammaproteobacteria bacterium]
MNSVRSTAGVLLLFLLVGCGFHLRGFDARRAALPSEMARTFLQALPGSLIADGLRQRLVDSGVLLVEEAELASAVLRLSGERFSRRVLSIDDSGKVGEYELRYQASFVVYQPQLPETVSTPRQTFSIEAQTLSVERIYQYDVAGVLGKSQEEILLREDMQRDLARLIFYRLQAAK